MKRVSTWSGTVSVAIPTKALSVTFNTALQQRDYLRYSNHDGDGARSTAGVGDKGCRRRLERDRSARTILGSGTRTT